MTEALPHIHWPLSPHLPVTACGAKGCFTFSSDYGRTWNAPELKKEEHVCACRVTDGPHTPCTCTCGRVLEVSEDGGYLRVLPLLPKEAVEKPETALEEAGRLVYGNRGVDYGHPRQDYERTAALWSAILKQPVTAEQAILCMIAVKLSRLAHAYKHDSAVDVAGYAECLVRVAENRP